MADFSQDKKYNYLWQSSKFQNLALSGSNISQFINDVGYITSAATIDTGSFLTTSSFNSYTGSSSSQFAGTASLALTASYFSGSISNAISASYATTASLALTASYFSGSISNAIYADTASYVNPLHQAVLITGSLNISGSIYNPNSVYFYTTASGVTQVGQLGWDDGYGTLDLMLKGGNVNVELGQENVVLVFNNSGTTLNKGEVVFVSGSQGNRPSVNRALATSDGYSVTTLGFAAESIASGAEGYVTTFGFINNINTSGSIGGTPVWLSPTVPGGWTTTKPQAPNHTVLLGYIVRVSNTVGSIFVHISNGWEIDELHDVRIISASSGDLILRSGSLWINTKQLTGSYGLTGSLEAISFTGSLFGTSSWAENAITASYVLNAVSSSFASTASYVLNAISSSFASTASFVQTAQTASYVLNAISSSFASTASYTPNAIITASISSNTITFTKGDNSTFPIVVPTGSGSGTVSGGALSGSFGITIDGAGSVLTVGNKGYAVIPYGGTITGWTMIANQTGDCVIDVWKAAGTIPTLSDSITGTEKPTLTTQQINSDTNLTTWTSSVSPGDIFAFNVDSASTLTRVNLSIYITKQ